MKKILSILLVVVIALSCFVGCTLPKQDLRAGDALVSEKINLTHNGNGNQVHAVDKDAEYYVYRLNPFTSLRPYVTDSKDFFSKDFVYKYYVCNGNYESAVEITETNAHEWVTEKATGTNLEGISTEITLNYPKVKVNKGETKYYFYEVSLTGFESVRSKIFSLGVSEYIGIPDESKLETNYHASMVLNFYNNEYSETAVVNNSIKLYPFASMTMPSAPKLNDKYFSHWEPADEKTSTFFGNVKYSAISKYTNDMLLENGDNSAESKRTYNFKAVYTDVPTSFSITYMTKVKGFLGIETWKEYEVRQVEIGQALNINTSIFGTDFVKMSLDKKGEDVVFTNYIPQGNLKVYLQFTDKKADTFKVIYKEFRPNNLDPKYDDLQAIYDVNGVEYFFTIKTETFKAQDFLKTSFVAPSITIESKTYDFDFWSLDAQGKNALTDDFVIKSDTVLYAQYKGLDIKKENGFAVAWNFIHEKIIKPMNAFWNVESDLLAYVITIPVLIVLCVIAIYLVLFIFKMLFRLISMVFGFRR